VNAFVLCALSDQDTASNGVDIGVGRRCAEMRSAPCPEAEGPDFPRTLCFCESAPWLSACRMPVSNALRAVFSIMSFDTQQSVMQDLFLHSLQDIYYAENQITQALPKMIEVATNRDLSAGLRLHLEETGKQIERLDKVFEKLGQKPAGTQCPAIDGIQGSQRSRGRSGRQGLPRCREHCKCASRGHHEICRYGTLIAWAEELGHEEVVRFLATNLKEEKAANNKLNTVALRKGVNTKASNAA
jgi:ferritin-like metal-binding protein YciE